MIRRRQTSGAWQALRPALLERGIASWLGERGSLTRRLRAGCGRLELILLRQRYARPLPDEVALLNLRRGERAWVREVLLLADGRPVLYAHSVARPASLRAAWRPLSRIGLKPVGDAIFERHGLQRGPISVRRLRAGDRLHRAANRVLAAQAALPSTSPPASLAAWRAASLPTPLSTPLSTLWARRSPFVQAGHALWITEVFLPAIAGVGAIRRARQPERRWA